MLTNKKNVVIAIITIILVVAAGASAYVFLKDDGTASASTNNLNQTGLANELVINEVTNNFENELVSAPSNQTSTNTTSSISNVVATTTNTTNTTVPNQEYVVEKIEEVEKQTAENTLIRWTPMDMNASLSTNNFGIYVPQINYAKIALTETENNSVRRGEVITYLLGVENTTNEAVLGFNLSDIIPNQTTLVENSITNNGVYNKELDRIDWKADIAANAIMFVGFAVTVNENAEGVISNIGIVNGNKTDETKNPIIEAEKSSKIFRNDIEISEPATIGDMIKYTVNVNNTGNMETVVNVKDSIPAGTELVSDIILNNEKINLTTMENGKDITILANDEVILTFDVKVVSTDNAIENTATIGKLTPSDKVETAGLQVEKTATIIKNDQNNNAKYANIAEVGDEIEYTVNVTNTGSMDLKDVYVEDENIKDKNGNKIDTTLDIPSKATVTALTFTHVVTEDDINVTVGEETVIYNNAVATWTDSENKIIDEDDATIPVRDIYEYTVEYYYNNVKDNTKTETENVIFETVINTYTDKIIEGYVFKKVEGTPLTIASDEVKNVINIYYMPRTDLSYTVNYLEKGTNKVLSPAKTVDNQTFGTSVTEQAIEIEGYNKIEPTSKTITIGVSGNEITFYYTKASFTYKVEYYYDGVKDATKTHVDTALFESVITAYPNKVIAGYKYQKEEGTPLTISTDTRQNVISVYYVKDKFGYKIEYYYNGVKDSSKTYTGTATEYGSVISTYQDKNIEGYKLEKTENLPLTISESTIRNVISVYYIPKTDLSYTVNYLEKGTNKVLAPAKTINNQTYGTSVTEQAIEIEGYNKVEPTSRTITISVSGNVINFYYTVKINLSYTVNYLEQGTNEVLSTAKTINNQTFGTQVTEQPINITGYDKVEPTSKTITIGVSGNVIDFYYTKATYGYTVEYYYDGVKDDRKTETLSALFETEITTYPDKANGYNFKSDTLPLVISAIAANNIIKVYYVSNSNITVEKVAPSTATVGSTIEYTITVRNSGGTEGTVNVTDTLPVGVTYVSSTNLGNYNSKERTITWNDIALSGVELAGNDKTVQLKVTVTIDKDQYGKTITNNVKLNNGKKASATTNISEKTITVNEMKEGQTGKSANIILIMDLSSSMNGTVSGQTYSESEALYVAPSDVSKTRIYAAKQAATNFVREIYAGSSSSDVRVSVIGFNTNRSGTDNTAVISSECTSNHNHNYQGVCQEGTDGKWYNLTTQNIKTGTQILTVSGTNNKASSTNYQGLITSINNLSIGSARSNYGTYIKPAFTAAEGLIDEYKSLNNNENIVIVLSDGEPNDVTLNGGREYTSATNAISAIKGKSATVYSIGFGSDAANSSNNSYKILEKFSTDGTVLTASNATTLSTQFKTIIASINTTSSETTSNGVLTLTAAKALAYPVEVYYNDKLLFTCATATDLSRYNLTYNSSTRQLIWDLNAYLRNNSGVKDFSGKLELTYHIKR